MCRALITLGTPHRGAPKALNWVVGGVRAGGLTWPGVTGLFRGWPSVAELLPRYPAVWDEPTQAARYPHELVIDWLRPAAKRNAHEGVSAGHDLMSPGCGEPCCGAGVAIAAGEGNVVPVIAGP